MGPGSTPECCGCANYDKRWLSRRLYLQVEEDNEAARVLYTRRGFTGHHGYHYRIAPATG